MMFVSFSFAEVIVVSGLLLFVAENARRLLQVNAHVASIIETHMWPLNINGVQEAQLQLEEERVFQIHHVL